MRSGHLALPRRASRLLGCASPGPGGRTAATPGAVSTLDPVSSQQWATDMAGFAAQDARQPPPAHPVVFTGSSSVRMWASLAADFPRQPVLNRGFGGSQLRDAIWQADQAPVGYQPGQTGKASCRERVVYVGYVSVGAVTLKKK